MVPALVLFGVLADDGTRGNGDLLSRSEMQVLENEWSLQVLENDFGCMQKSITPWTYTYGELKAWMAPCVSRFLEEDSQRNRTDEFVRSISFGPEQHWDFGYNGTSDVPQVLRLHGYQELRENFLIGHNTDLQTALVGSTYWNQLIVSEDLKESWVAPAKGAWDRGPGGFPDPRTGAPGRIRWAPGSLNTSWHVPHVSVQIDIQAENFVNFVLPALGGPVNLFVMGDEPFPSTCAVGAACVHPRKLTGVGSVFQTSESSTHRTIATEHSWTARSCCTCTRTTRVSSIASSVGTLVQ
jgi:hypothetical protein